MTKLAGFHNHIRLDSGLVPRRSAGTSALSKQAALEGGVSSERAKEIARFRKGYFALLFVPFANFAVSLYSWLSCEFRLWTFNHARTI